MGFKEELLLRAGEYVGKRQLALADELGFGIHGIVLATEDQAEKPCPGIRSAIKAHRREVDYQRERDVYLRLRDRKITTIRGCHVPRLLEYDDDLWIIEMTIVSPPPGVSSTSS